MNQRPSVDAAVITVSDRSARGERPDTSGPVAVTLLREAGYSAGEARIVPDGALPVREAIEAALEAGARFIVTTGGTGIGPRDFTPEGTRPLLSKELPGIPEALRRVGASSTPFAVVSRGLAGIVGDPPRALVVNLPGSVNAVTEALVVLLPLVPHILDQLDGGDH